MARQGKTLPARRPRSGTDESLIIRSAESLGRMIGSLQRQLDGASKRLGPAKLSGVFGVDGHDVKGSSLASSKTTRADSSRARTKSVKGAASGAAKTGSAPDRKSKRASKAAIATKSPGRSRSSATRKSAKRQR